MFWAVVGKILGGLGKLLGSEIAPETAKWELKGKKGNKGAKDRILRGASTPR